ncbi:thioredoxin reductase 1, cytoplasmic isoform X1 [Daphnia magna]|uniref:thioredoxin-disulfide reductase (NADPH) n=2 Tax=Daphnia magna TaxID=35525 RepID=A0A0N8DCL2_9CRUS|nr:thioredoxin reductase 1, cytoplasmic isoform X1 [Daphnia magna]KZS14998.1 Thioredoxin reductase 2, mitochondrial [Daphnia magna]
MSSRSLLPQFFCAVERRLTLGISRQTSCTKTVIRRVSYLKQKSVIALTRRHLISDIQGFIPCQRYTTSTMAPVIPKGDPIQIIDNLIKNNRIAIFSKTTCPFCMKVKKLFSSLNLEVAVIELDTREDGDDIQDALLQKTGQKTVPNVFVSGENVGGCDNTIAAHQNGRLEFLLNKSQAGPKTEIPDDVKYDYDLVVIGGGSGGLAASKEAALLGAKVAVCDFVVPTPIGTTWGLGGTCVNVGCIPKKLMHQAAILGQSVSDAKKFGWELPDTAKHNWHTMVEGIQAHIGSLNWGYRVALREKKVNYLNAFAEFVDPHTLKTTDKKKKETTITSKYILLATGGRPRYPDIPGAREFGITSDDIFSLPHHPGKTLLVGASYIALECAGFLAGIGVDSTVMVRSILLRGFDQQIAELIGSYMAKHGIRFQRGYVPIKLERIEEGSPGRIKVTSQNELGELMEEEYNTVLFAIGRDACTNNIGIEKANVMLNTRNGKVICDEKEQTNVPHIYAIGDILDGKLELTPVAIQAGRLLAKRLFGGGTLITDYVNVPTTVFTPLEYGSVGFSEEDAIAKYGANDIEVYHSFLTPLEVTIPKRDDNEGYAKLICVKSLNEKVVGFHILSPNAGEITQGFAIGLKLGATKADFDNLIGIHPTIAEVFTTLNTTKSSGADVLQKGC